MNLKLVLLIAFSLALRSNGAEERKGPLAPRQVCDVVDHIDVLKGQRVVVQGIFSWEDRHGTAGLRDCRPHQCSDTNALLRVRWAPREIRSISRLDDSYDQMMHELAKQRIYKAIVTLEGLIQVVDDPFSHPSLKRKIVVLDVPSVKSRKPFPNGQKRSNYCEGE